MLDAAIESCLGAVMSWHFWFQSLGLSTIPGAFCRAATENASTKIYYIRKSTTIRPNQTHAWRYAYSIRKPWKLETSSQPNHIGSKLTSNYKIFADDLKLYACVNPSLSGACPGTAQSIQADINTLHGTSESWGLTLNREKCAVLRFTRNSREPVPPEYFLDGSPLPICKTHGDLGLLVEDKLKFHDHVSSVAHKAYGLCQSFLKSTVCRTPDFMMFLLTTHIRPLMEYASCIWNTGYMTDLRKLERVQRMWTRQIKGLEGLSYGERLSELSLFSVQGRLLRADLIQYWKIFHDLSCIKPEDMFTQPPRSGTRGHRFKIHVTHAALDVCKRSFSHRSVALWNGLPDSVVAAADLSTFKMALSRVIHDDLYKFVDWLPTQNTICLVNCIYYSVTSDCTT